MFGPKLFASALGADWLWKFKSVRAFSWAMGMVQTKAATSGAGQPRKLGRINRTIASERKISWE